MGTLLISYYTTLHLALADFPREARLIRLDCLLWRTAVREKLIIITDH